MTNQQVVDEFIRVLLEAPMTTMQAIHIRLSMTDYELVLKHADPCKQFHEKENFLFPMSTAEKVAAHSD